MGQTHKNKRHQVRHLVWLMAASSLASGVARAEELPLFLSLSQSFTRDDNLLRDNANKRQDTISTTTVSGGVDKAYGRQTYRLSAAASHSSYSRNDQFNNDGYAGSADVTSDIASDFRLSLSGAASQFLPNFENQYGDRLVRNLQNNRQYSADLRYGLYGRWSVNTAFSHSAVDYKVTEQENKSSDTVSVGLRYLPSDLVYFGLNASRTDTSVPNRVLVGVARVGEDIQRTSVGLNTSWVVTGFSRLSGSIAATQEKHPADRRRDFNGYTGSAAWDYTPGGKMSYGLSWVRDTSNEGGQTLGKNLNADSVYSTNNRLINTFKLSARWQATSKIAVSAGYAHTLYKEDYGIASLQQISSVSKDGRYSAYTLGVSYQPIRAVGLGCDLMNYDRTQSTFSRAYSGNTVTCRASFTIE